MLCHGQRPPAAAAAAAAAAGAAATADYSSRSPLLTLVLRGGGLVAGPSNTLVWPVEQRMIGVSAAKKEFFVSSVTQQEHLPVTHAIWQACRTVIAAKEVVLLQGCKRFLTSPLSFVYTASCMH